MERSSSAPADARQACSAVVEKGRARLVSTGRTSGPGKLSYSFVLESVERMCIMFR